MGRIERKLKEKKKRKRIMMMKRKRKRTPKEKMRKAIYLMKKGLNLMRVSSKSRLFVENEYERVSCSILLNGVDGLKQQTPGSPWRICSRVLTSLMHLKRGRSSRKRKRKHGAPHTPSKKKQPRSSAVYNVMDVEVSIADKHLPSAPLNKSLLADLPSPSQFIGLGHGGESNGDVNNIKTSKQTDENGSINGSKHIFERKEDNEYDPKLSELIGTIPNIDVNTNKFTIHFQEEKASEGNGIANGLPKVDYADLVQNSRCTGAKKRKSGSVKRFKKDSVMCEQVFLPNSSGNFSVGSTGAAAQPGIENPSLTWGNSSHMPMTENSINAFAITKILKPIGFSASVFDNVQDVLITFRALRSDGQEVTVDNKFLKANNPHLLINFYEQHLKYST
ncbi:chromo domain-containing protein LHP1 isoform X5 [Populus nigra]|uniref:chromo domain-containing protein LHP1 isoform X5 n=1 Tax=Populus nigra TaxID=3691 RepID=UPI002B27B580|nr:chromo domain-containing protein LHP1 isoform X5 [Populus nigra]